ncbi:Endonuclease/exonuclease/phosphatase [Lipomyces oligophaga]|uniref:Endonuclease/exonuclease/phosphatase n=1 Tax=Lipomyces oligophaga TaxID=45792 RepID=UPI0034CE4233
MISSSDSAMASTISLENVTTGLSSSRSVEQAHMTTDSSSKDGLEFKVLTLNCWGLKFVSKHRKARMQYIAHELAHSEADIVALQECWVHDDYVYIRQQTEKIFPYGKFFYSGILAGPGLAVISRFPIESVSMIPYTINGRPSAFFRGDWYVGKGIASAVIRHPKSGVAIELFNTHMHAPYGPGDASYVCHRTAQAWQLSGQIRAAVERGHLAIAVGDFNSRPDSLTYSLLVKRAGLEDSWTTVHGTRREGILASTLDPLEQIELLGITCDSQLNTWRSDRDISEAQRLDYVFHEPHLSTATKIEVAFTDRVPVLNESASDHFGVLVNMRVLPSIAARHVAGLNQSPDLPIVNRPDQNGLPLDRYEAILDIIETYLPTAHAQKFYRIMHFFVSILALVVLHIGVFWVKMGWPVFLVLLGSVIIALTGLLDGLIGYLFGRNEIRALREFEEEVFWELTRKKELQAATIDSKTV